MKPLAKLLLDLITRSEVCLSFANHSWKQKLKRGVLQGSAFSAELFARTLDFFISPLLAEWETAEVTWVETTLGMTTITALESFGGALQEGFVKDLQPC